jgi:radical SAM superfamily enzyme YgiQ (UPF0313 family)
MLPFSGIKCKISTLLIKTHVFDCYFNKLAYADSVTIKDVRKYFPMKKNIFFCEFSFTNEPTVLPHNYGHIRLYSESYPEIVGNYNWKNPFGTFPIELPTIKQPGIFAFSVYVWNVERSIHASKMIKEKYPSCKIIMGGPHFSRDCKDFLKTNDHIDFIVNKEGENSFQHLLLENLKDTPIWKNVKGITFVDGGEVVQTKPADRVNLSEMTESPYEKYFDIYNDIASRAREHNHEVFGVIETNRGCPYECGFCNWGALTANKIFQVPFEKIKKDVKYLSLLKVRRLQIADANFGMLPRDAKIAKIIVDAFKNDGNQVVNLCITYAKVFNNKVIEAYKVLRTGKWKYLSDMSIAMQSMNPDSLVAIKRENIGEKEFPKKLQLIKEHFPKLDHISTDIIIGLPEETLDTYIDGIITCYISGIKNFILYNLALLPGTDIATQRMIDKYSLKYSEAKFTNNTYSNYQNIEFVESIQIVYQTSTMSREEIIYCTLLTAMLKSCIKLFGRVIPKDILESKEKFKEICISFLEILIQTNKELNKLSNNNNNFEYFNPLYWRAVNLLDNNIIKNETLYIKLLTLAREKVLNKKAS